MEACRREGFVLEVGEMVQGLSTVAVAVTGVSGTPIGYIVLIGLFSVETARDLGPFVAGAGRALSQQLGAGKE